MREAGLPDGVINFIPGSGAEIGDNGGECNGGLEIKVN